MINLVKKYLLEISIMLSDFIIYSLEKTLLISNTILIGLCLLVLLSYSLSKIYGLMFKKRVQIFKDITVYLYTFGLWFLAFFVTFIMKQVKYTENIFIIWILAILITCVVIFDKKVLKDNVEKNNLFFFLFFPITFIFVIFSYRITYVLYIRVISYLVIILTYFVTWYIFKRNKDEKA